MKSLISFWKIVIVFLVGITLTCLCGQDYSNSRAAGSSAWLGGTVTSASGEKMEGVTVSAKEQSTTITTSVFTDEKGNYYLPALKPGTYRIWAQADCFQTSFANLEMNGTSRQDFTLSPLQDFERQLTGDQVLESLPESTPEARRLKHAFRNTCTSCHQPNYVLQNRFDQDGWVAIMNLMENITVAGAYLNQDSVHAPIVEFEKKDLAAYLAKARGPGTTTMALKVRPRPTGDAARAVIIEYEVPLDPSRKLETKYPTNDGSDWSLGTPSSLNGSHGVHDAQADLNGNIWYTNNVQSRDITIGRVDADSGAVRYFKVPTADGNAATSHAIVRDSRGVLWFNINAGGPQNALGSIDPATEKIEIYNTPKGMTPVTGVATSMDVDGKGKIWVTSGTGALRFDPDTQQFSEFKSLSYKTPDGIGMTYGIAGDASGNGWWAQMGIDVVGYSDIRSGKSLEIKLPSEPGQNEMTTGEKLEFYKAAASNFDMGVPWAQGPRRMGADKNASFVWVCDWWGGNLAKIDIRTKSLTLTPLPKPDSQQPYQAVVDQHHNVWINLMNSDEVLKFNPSTLQWTEYPLPTLGAETRYLSLLERNGALEIILPYSRTRKVARMTFRSKEDLQALQKQLQ